MKKNSIVILGAGESYIYSFFNLISSVKENFFISYLPVDFGGSSGLWNRLIDYNDSELNKKLHNQILPNLPWGDYNKTIKLFLQKKAGNIVAETLDFRSNDLAELINEFDILADFLALEQDIEKKFYHYLITSFDYYNEFSDKIIFETKKPLCFGYIWQNFLYFMTNGDLSKMSSFYNNLGIIPENLFLDFTFLDRQILIAKDTNNTELTGEDIIDEHSVSILLDSYRIEQIKKNKDIEKFSFNFLNTLKSADLIIIPPGSIANWLPLFNYPEITNILKNNYQNLYWLLNPFFASNELPMIKYIQYLTKLKIYPKLVYSKDIENITGSNVNVLNKDYLSKAMNTQNLDYLEIESKSGIYTSNSVKKLFVKILNKSLFNSN